MYKTSLTSTVRRLGRSHGSLATLEARCARHFSTSQSYRAFADSENPELSAILKEIQEKIILPGRLPYEQRKIIFNPNQKAYLEQNPIVIEVDGEDYKFKTIDKAKDIPRKRIIFEALAKFETKGDWKKLSAILSGYKRAGIKVRPLTPTIIRMAGTAGHIEAVIECAKQVENTRLFIDDREKLVTVFHALCVRIMAASSTEGPAGIAKIEWAVKQAEQVIDLLQRQPHQARAALQARGARQQLHNSLTARGMLLYARAALAEAKQRAGQPATEEITKLQDEAKALRALWEPFQDKGVFNISEFFYLHPKSRNARAVSQTMYTSVLCWSIKAIELAKSMSVEEAADLSHVADALESNLQESAQHPKFYERAVPVYESILGRSASWPEPELKPDVPEKNSEVPEKNSEVPEKSDS